MDDSIDDAIRAGEPPQKPARPQPSRPKGAVHYRFVLLACALLLVLPVFVVCLLPSELCRVRFGRPYVTWEDYHEMREKIKPGMTADEVETAIGQPHKKIRGGDGTASWWIYYMRSSLSPLIDGHVGVEFDRNGRVRTLFEDH
jgi:outer membrane protein assembly factor BamE (lipoprotein component of BamABCDE complex)